MSAGDGPPYDWMAHAMASDRTVAELRDQLAATKRELEREQLRLAACGVVALADTPESAKQARNMHPDYMSGSCNSVARRVDECMDLRKRLAAEKKESETLGTAYECLLDLVKTYQMTQDADIDWSKFPSECVSLCHEENRQLRLKLERARHKLVNASVCELGAENLNVADYMAHWEGRAKKAEDSNRELREYMDALPGD